MLSSQGILKNWCRFRRKLARVCGLLMSLFMSLLASLPIQAEDTQPVVLKAAPMQCVAMTQGQMCYLDVEISWHSQQVDDYCLYTSLQSKPIKCWTAQAKGIFKREFASKNNIQFHLRRQNQELNLSSVEVEIAWVHKKRGQPQNWWRIF